MGHFLIIPFINPYMEFNNGYSRQQTPLIYLVGGVAAFFASNILGKISDKYGKLKVFMICILLSLPLVVIITNMQPISLQLFCFSLPSGLSWLQAGVLRRRLWSACGRNRKTWQFYEFQ
jgi:predicted MFS family arabinose efflux permease